MKVIYITSANKEDWMELANLAKKPWVIIEFVETAEQVKSSLAFQKKNISVKTVIFVSTSYSLLS